MSASFSIVPLCTTMSQLACVYAVAAAAAQAVAVGGNASLARKENATSLLNGANAGFGIGSLAAAPVQGAAR